MVPRGLVLVLALAATLLAGCTGDDGGSGEVGADAPESLTVRSSEFTNGQPMPVKHTCDGANIKPPLRIEGLPDDAVSVVLIMDDPDAPSGDFLHYTVWNIPADDASWEEGADLRGRGAVEGANGRGQTGYIGPCPPEGDGPHRYFFRAYALDAALDLPSGTERDDLESAMQGSVVARGTLMGTYQRGATA